MTRPPVIAIELATADDTEAWGATLAACLRGGLLVWLSGDLGAGKTTLVRGVLRGLGHAGSVKSPTFTLVEPYEDDVAFRVYHFDLYRMQHPGELEDLGWRDYPDAESICFVEWPQKGAGILPAPDITITITRTDHARHVELKAGSPAGCKVLECL